MSIAIEIVKMPENAVAIFNDGASVFVVDDGCYVLKNLIDGEFKNSSHIFGEAVEVLLQLPENPRDALRKNEAPKITPDDIEANVVSEHYFTAADGAIAAGGPYDMYDAIHNPLPPSLRLLTFCVLVLRNGFTVTGESACVSPENFDAEIGQNIARQNAVSKIWPLMGYALKNKLAFEPEVSA